MFNVNLLSNLIYFILLLLWSFLHSRFIKLYQKNKKTYQAIKIKLMIYTFVVNTDEAYFKIFKASFFRSCTSFFTTISPYLIINKYSLLNLSIINEYLLILILFIVASEILFRVLYKLVNKQNYSRIEKISFKDLSVEPHPNLPFIHKKNFKSSLGSSILNYPLSKDLYSSLPLQTNNLGYVNGIDGARNVKIPKPKDLFRINCLGASTTQNYLQFNNEVYSYPLELEKILKTKSHKNIEVNNCGSGGYTSSDIFLKTLLQNLDTDPNVIIFYHAYNDIKSYLTPGYLSDYSHSRKNLGENYYKFYLGSFIPNIPVNFINYLVNKWFPQNHDIRLLKIFRQIIMIN